jgi:hypothetical protein
VTIVRPRFPLLVLLLLATVLGPPARAQEIVEQDITPGEGYEGVEPELVQELALAEDLLRSLRYEAARQRLDEVVFALDAGEPTPSSRSLLEQALVWRAIASFRLEQAEASRADFERLLTLDPGARLPEGVDRDVARLFESVRDRLVGTLVLDVEPADTRVVAIELGEGENGETASTRVARELSLPEDVLPVGRYRLELNRPGFAAANLEVDVEGGKRRPVTVALERSGPTLVISTQPPGATVYLDGEAVGVTEAKIRGGLASDGFSRELWIEGIEPGAHRVEVRREGFREFATVATVDGDVDARLAPIVLEPESATLVLRELPDSAEVWIDGLLLRRAGNRQERLQLSPGRHRLRVSGEDDRVFERTVELADGEIETLAVELRSPIVLAGVLGGDDEAAAQVRTRLVDALDAEGDWALLDREEELAPVLAELTIDAAGLRDDESRAPDWRALRDRMDAASNGRLFALAILDDDLYARSVELLIWPPEPGPARPEIQRLDIASSEDWQQLSERLSAPLRWQRPSLDALVIDSEAAAAPVIAAVIPGGAAGAAGLEPGDLLTAIDGEPVFTVSQVLARLAGVTERALTLEVRPRPDAEARSVELRPRSALMTVAGIRTPTSRAVIAARILDALGRATEEVPRWLLQLDRGLLHVEAGEWQQAIEILRSIEAPARRGLGQGAVDYYLGLALEKAGPRYAELARDAFRRAAAAEGARLEADDGPLLRPRALFHLARLEGE